MRGLDESFRRTGISKDEFSISKWDKDRNGSK
ncbi:hypothetical protein I7860_23710 [Pseudomonas tolaasii]|nr:polymorphic toxin type 47 domain-containing protein [Pseudomonas tolaasii]MBW1249686.1 hypothetical protein [Pseudomonas tolaasii]